MVLIHRLISLLIPIGMALAVYYSDKSYLSISVIGLYSLYEGFESVKDNIQIIYDLCAFWFIFIFITYNIYETYFNPLAIICSLSLWGIDVLYKKEHFNIGFFVIMNLIYYALFIFLFKLL